MSIDKRQITRRQLMKYAGGTAAAAALGGIFDGYCLEPNSLDVTRPVISLANLPPAWDGLRIAHLTDLHYLWKPPRKFFEQAFAIVNSEAPDIVILTGDCFCSCKAVSNDLRDMLAVISAPLGKFAVLGNHDVGYGLEKISAVITTAGFTLLRNDNRMLLRGDQALCIGGVEDLWRGNPLILPTFQGVPDAAARLLLCHNPDFADQLPPELRVDLMLCGHTHGGQINLPVIHSLMLPIRNHKYAAGLAAGPCCPVYTSRGIGMGGPGLRINCRPELPIITLRRA